MITVKSEKCTIGKYKEHYKDDFNHSKYLKAVFGVFNYQGCDYVNPKGVNIEFKESFTYHKPDNRVRFAVYEKDKLESKYIVFVYKNKSYVHKTHLILAKYKFNPPKYLAQPYLSRVSRNYTASFTDLQSLKVYLDNLE